jgi:hypothetical protein
VYLCGVKDTNFGIAEHHGSLQHALLLPAACPAAAGVASLMTTKKEKAKKEKAKKEKAKEEKASEEGEGEGLEGVDHTGRTRGGARRSCACSRQPARATRTQEREDA